MKKSKLSNNAIKSLIVLLALVLSVGIGVASAATISPTPLSSSEETLSPKDMWEVVKDAELTGNKDGPATAVSMNGINVKNLVDGATIRYKNYLDVSNNCDEDPLVSFLFVPAVVGNPDIKQVVFRFEDALNPDNYVNIKAIHDSYVGRESMSFFQASFPGVEYRAVQWGSKGDPLRTDPWNGLEVPKSFAGLCFEADYWGNDASHVSKDPNARQEAMRISYDPSERAFYADMGSWFGMILDLDEPAHVGYGNEWGGFESGLISMSITVSNFASASGNYLILDVNGNSMSGDVLVDGKAPTLNVYAPQEAPRAQLGTSYKIFDSTADDEIDGNMNSSIVVSLVKPNNETVVLDGERFVPTAVGTHILRYSVTDKAGNNTTKEISIVAQMMISPIVFEIDGVIPTAAVVGQRITVPALRATGGSGKLETSISVTRLPGGKEYALSNRGDFTPELTGLYSVHYSALDYIGGQKDEIYYINVTRGDAPFAYWIDDEDFPKAFIHGKQVMLPSIEAHDFVSDFAMATRIEPKVEVSYDDGATFSPIDGLMFVPEIEEGEVKIKYVFSTLKGSDERVYTAKVLNPKYIWDYFILNNITTHHYSDSDLRTFIEFQAESTQTNSSIEFINPVSANNFSLMFSVPEHLNNFSSITLTMIDSLNPEERLSFEVRKTAGSKSDVYLNGQKYNMMGSFFTYEPIIPFEFKFSNSSLTMLDYENNTIAKISKLASGLPFTGFSSGSVYFRLDMKDVEGASGIRLQKICNQSIFPSYSAGEIALFRDNAAPLIERGFEPELDATINQRLFLPKARAIDVIDPYVNAYLTVRDPSGEVVSGLNNVLASEERSFIASMYGSYEIVYSAVDSSNRSASIKYIINVTDSEQPDIFLERTLPEKIKLGDQFDIPKATVFGRTDDIKLYVYIIMPDLVMKEITTLESYVFEMRGEHTILYYAVNADNYSFVKDIKVFVE